MINSLFTKTKRTVLIASAAVFAIATVANASQPAEETYVIQGLSKSSLIELVNQVGGELVHDFSVISAVSASLTKQQLEAISNANPMVRISQDQDANKTAGFIWGQKRPSTNVAGFIWGQKRPTTKVAGFIWGQKRPTTKVAGFIWGQKRPSTNVAGFIWGQKRPSTNVAGFIWGQKRPTTKLAGFIWGQKRPTTKLA